MAPRSLPCPIRSFFRAVESPRVQLLALRSPDRAAHSPERRLPRVRRVLYLVGAIVFVDTMFFAALTPLLPQYGTVIPEGAGCVKRLLSSGFAGFRAPCRQHWVRAGVKTERPQRSEDDGLDAGPARCMLSA